MFTRKKIAAAVVFSALAGGAQAALVTGASGLVASDDAELFFIAYDPTTQHTLVKDLGLSYSFLAANSASTSWFTALDLGALVTSGTGAGNFNFSTGLQWNLGVAIKNGSVLGAANNGAFATVNLSTSSDLAKADLQSGTTFNSARSKLSALETAITGKAGYINTHFISAGYPSASDNALIIEDDPAQSDAFNVSWGTNFNLQLPQLDNSGTLGDSLAFYHWYLDNPGGTAKVVSAQLAGVWTLSTEGVLSYGAPEVAAVPVPAAAWLFGSALAGLGIFPRRRKNHV